MPLGMNLEAVEFSPRDWLIKVSARMGLKVEFSTLAVTFEALALGLGGTLIKESWKHTQTSRQVA